MLPSGAFGRLFVVAVCIGLVFCGISPFAPVIASAETELFYAASWQELQQAVDDGAGRIELTADLVIDDYCDLYSDLPVVVNMGAHTAEIVDGGILKATGPIFFEGGTGPLFTVQDGGYLDLRKGASIAAKGEGAVAVLLELSESSLLNAIYSSISASGKNAVAVRGLGEVALEFADILAEGENSVGILCADRVSLNFTRVRADGTAVWSENGPYTLNCVTFYSAGEQYQVRPVEARVYFGLEQGFSSRQGEEIQLPDMLAYVLLWSTVGEKGYPWALPIPVDWDTSQVNIHEPGVYTVTATPWLHLPDLPYIFPDPFTIDYTVVEHDRPYISEGNIFMPNILNLQFLPGIADDAEITLYYSPNPDGPWEAVPAFDGSLPGEPAADISAYYAMISGCIEMGAHNYYYIEVAGGPVEGISNIFDMYYDEDDPGNSLSGDRDGGDRADVPFSWGNPYVPPSDGPTPDPTPDPTPTPEPKPVPGPVVRSDRDTGGTTRRDADNNQPVIADPQVPAASAAVMEPAAVVEPAAQQAALSQPQQLPEADVFQPPASAQSFSRREILDLAAANPEQVTFLQSGLKLVIPAAELEKLAPPDGGRLYILLEKTSDGFEVRLYDEAGELSPGGAMTVWAPAPEGRAFCVGPGFRREAVARDGELAAFLVDGCGSFQIDVEAEEAPVAQAEPALPAENPPMMDIFSPERAAPERNGTGGQIAVAGVWSFLTAVSLVVQRVRRP